MDQEKEIIHDLMLLLHPVFLLAYSHLYEIENSLNDYLLRLYRDHYFFPSI